MRCTIGLVALLSVALPAVSPAQQLKKALASNPPAKNPAISRVQGPLQGGNGVFGSVYTLNSGWNFTILRARYTVDPFASYEGLSADTDSKLLVLSLAITNSLPAELFFGGLECLAFDEAGHAYRSSDCRLKSLGGAKNTFSLKPGQGVGQRPDQDDLSVAFKIPGKARICKLILLDGRRFVREEKEVCYYIAGVATTARNGESGNPRNAIAPLPDFVRDPTDPTGATALSVAPANLSVPVPTGYYLVCIDSITLSSTEKCNGKLPSEGKQYAIVTMSVKNSRGRARELFDLLSEETTVLTDAKGEQYAVVAGTYKRNMTRDEALASSLVLQPGESHTFRHFYEVPNNVTLRAVNFGQENGRKYTVDLAEGR